MFNYVKEEQNKANATEAPSDFEVFMLGEIAQWRSLQDCVFEDWKDAVDAFWKEKLD